MSIFTFSLCWASPSNPSMEVDHFTEFFGWMHLNRINININIFRNELKSNRYDKRMKHTHTHTQNIILEEKSYSFSKKRFTAPDSLGFVGKKITYSLWSPPTHSCCVENTYRHRWNTSPGHLATCTDITVTAKGISRVTESAPTLRQDSHKCLHHAGFSRESETGPWIIQQVSPTLNNNWQASFDISNE